MLNRRINNLLLAVLFKVQSSLVALFGITDHTTQLFTASNTDIARAGARDRCRYVIKKVLNKWRENKAC